jgi:hypothetical protein
MVLLPTPFPPVIVYTAFLKGSYIASKLPNVSEIFNLKLYHGTPNKYLFNYIL